MFTLNLFCCGSGKPREVQKYIVRKSRSFLVTSSPSKGGLALPVLPTTGSGNRLDRDITSKVFSDFALWEFEKPSGNYLTKRYFNDR